VAAAVVEVPSTPDMGTVILGGIPKAQVMVKVVLAYHRLGEIRLIEDMLEDMVRLVLRVVLR
jgi:hypothetical protein